MYFIITISFLDNFIKEAQKAVKANANIVVATSLFCEQQRSEALISRDNVRGTFSLSICWQEIESQGTQEMNWRGLWLHPLHHASLLTHLNQADLNRTGLGIKGWGRDAAHAFFIPSLSLILPQQQPLEQCWGHSAHLWQLNYDNPGFRKCT